MARSRRGFGMIKQMRSGRWQASYIGPDKARHNAPETFATKAPAESWLTGRRREMEEGTWAPMHAHEPMYPVRRDVTLGEYFVIWLGQRDLKPRTVDLYGSLARRLILPDLGAFALTRITPAAVRSWHASVGLGTPTQRAHAYGLLKTVLATAVVDDLLTANPCQIRKASAIRPVHKVKPATLAQLRTIVGSMPPRYRAMVLLAAWGAARFGELAELRRGDIDIARGVMHIRRGVVYVPGHGSVVGTPKSEAGIRDVAIPPHIIPVLQGHLRDHVTPGPDSLLFPAAGDSSKHLKPVSLYRVYYPARAGADRPDLRFHDLRHTGAVLAAQTGATLIELMGRLGHSTPQAAMRYQHVARDRDSAIARALSDLATSG